MQKELQLLGLTKNEGIVYEALVSLGPCKAGPLIARLDIHRNIVYRTLDSLSENGYVTKIIKNGIQHFQIADPESLLISAHRKELMFAEVMKEISEVQNRATSQIVVYEGVASYRNYWIQSLDRLPDGTVDYVAGGEIKKWSKILGNKYGEYVKKIKEKNMSWKTLYLNRLNEEEIKLLKNAPVPTECRMWSTNEAKFFGNFNVLADTVILHTPSEKMPKIVEMRDPALVTMFSHFFNLMWEKADPVNLN